jgi:hypothetical protein
VFSTETPALEGDGLELERRLLHRDLVTAAIETKDLSNNIRARTLQPIRAQALQCQARGK